MGEFKEGERKLQREVDEFQGKETKLQREAKKSSDLWESLKSEFKERENKLQQDVKTSRDLLDSLKMEFKERERMPQRQLDAADDRVRQLEDGKTQQASQCEEGHVQQIRDLKKRIESLQRSDDELSREVREANKSRERALRDKEDEHLATVRELKTKHDKLLVQKEDSHLEELRGSKKRSERREQEWIEKENALLKQMQEETQIQRLIQLKNDEFDKGIEKIVREKEEEFESEVSKFQSGIKRLRKQSKDATEDKMIANELETQMLECKKEFDRQRRKHRSEIKMLNNTMELQKSKEGRLLSHIESLEKQITDMVNDYESRLQDAFYDNM